MFPYRRWALCILTLLAALCACNWHAAALPEGHPGEDLFSGMIAISFSREQEQALPDFTHEMSIHPHDFDGFHTLTDTSVADFVSAEQL